MIYVFSLVPTPCLKSMAAGVSAHQPTGFPTKQFTKPCDRCAVSHCINAGYFGSRLVLNDSRCFFNFPNLISDPLDFTGDSSSAGGDCKSSDAECVFPFRYKGTWHNGCTDVDRGGGDSGSKWCATRVNRRTKEMLDNFWGVCQMSSCPTDGEDTD